MVFYDQRGTGLSPRVDDDELTFENYLADLDALVERFSPGRPVNLIGHSFGGMLISGYLGRYPGKVGGAIFAEPGPLTWELANHPNFKFRPGLRFASHAAGSWIESRFYSGPDSHAKGDYFFGKFFGAYHGRGHPAAGYYCGGVPPQEARQRRLGSRAYWKVSKSYPSVGPARQFSMVQGVAAFDKQVLFLAGSCDVILGAEIQREQMKHFTDARLVVIDGVGHELFAENPEASLVPVKEYLGKHNQ